MRAAVATGEAVVQLGAQPGTGEGIATGDVVNTAARLQGQAPVGGLVVNEQAYRATRQAIRLRGAAGARAQGQGRARRLPGGAVGARAGSASTPRRLRATPFVGRDRELRLLQDTFERMVGESEIQLVTITGEPGVGKTRLLAEFRAWVDDRPELVYWRQGRCLPYGDGITFWALGEIVKAHAGILESDAPDEAARSSRKPSPAMDDADWLQDAPRPARRARRAQARPTARSRSPPGSGSSRSIAARGPLVLLFEDLHWADDALLEFVERLVDWSSGLPILVLCTGRPELYEQPSRMGRRQAELDDRRAVPPLARGDRAARRRPSSTRPCCRRRRRLRSSNEPAATRCTRRSTRGCSSSSAPPRTCRCPTPSRGSSPRGSTRCRPSGSRCSRMRRSSARCSGPARSSRWAGATERAVRDGLHQLAQEGAPAARAALVRRRPGRVRVLARAHPRRRLRPDSPLGPCREASGRCRLDRGDGRSEARRPLGAARASHDRGDRARPGSRRRRPTRSSSSERRGTSCSRAIALSSSTSARRPRATAGPSSSSLRARRSTASRF